MMKRKSCYIRFVYVQYPRVEPSPDDYIGPFPSKRAATKHRKTWGPQWEAKDNEPGASIVYDLPEGARLMSPEDHVAHMKDRW